MSRATRDEQRVSASASEMRVTRRAPLALVGGSLQGCEASMSIRWSDFCMKQFHSNGRADYTPGSTPTPGPDAACGPNDRLPAGAGDQPTRWRVCERDLSNCSGKLPCSTRTLFIAVLAPVSRMRAAFNHWNPHLHAASKACTRAVGHRRVPTQTDFVQRTARVR